jgi:hypothetical protein
MQSITVNDPRPRDEYYLGLEEGNILLFPATPFDLPQEDQDLLRSTTQTGGSHHKNIAYRPAIDKVTNFDSASVHDPEKLRAVMRNYSERVLAFLRSFVPRYMDNCRIDYASFRPQEEEGRSLPLTKRNDLLHVDSFPTRPTSGDLILRTFTNINPVQSRVWLTSDPFRPLAELYAMDAGLPRAAKGSMTQQFASLMRAAGLPLKDRSSYDRFMLGFHDYLKENEVYQKTCAKYRFEFPPNSTWMVFTDVVPHAVLSGQFALEQTVIVNRHNLLSSDNAPISILENICHRRLAEQ